MTKQTATRKYIAWALSGALLFSNVTIARAVNEGAEAISPPAATQTDTGQSGTLGETPDAQTPSTDDDLPLVLPIEPESDAEAEAPPADTETTPEPEDTDETPSDETAAAPDDESGDAIDTPEADQPDGDASADEDTDPQPDAEDATAQPDEPTVEAPTDDATEPTSSRIAITSLDELALIGVAPEYPLSGAYDLMCDLVGGEFAPIGSADAPFTGEFNGNGHAIAGLYLTGEHAGFFGVLSGTVRDLVLTGLTVEGETAGLLAGTLSGATLENVLVTGSVTGTQVGAVAGSASGGLYGVTYYTEAGLPAVGEGEGAGAQVLRSQPPYIAIVTTQTAQLGADAQLGPFTFSHFAGEEGFSLSDETARDAALTPLATGRFTLYAVYTCAIGDEVQELRIAISVIISEDASGLKTLDGVFYSQLGDYEVVQISALEPLELLEGVFAETIVNDEENGKTEDEAEDKTASDEQPVNIITSWQDFKNIGNEDYDPNYTMFATYLLGADITSDGGAFTPIGSEESPFYGHFDGNGYTINIANNPEIDVTKPYSGLFDVVRKYEPETDEPQTTETEEAESTDEPDADESAQTPEAELPEDSSATTAPEVPEETPDASAQPDAAEETAPATEPEDGGTDDAAE